MTEPLTADEQGRRDDLLLMLLHGGAASDSIARHVVNALAAEVRAEQAAEVARLRARVAELETFGRGCDAEGCVLPHSSWCERAKEAAAENDGCTCPQPWKGTPQPHAGYCWLVSPPRDEVERLTRANLEAAERAQRVIDGLRAEVAELKAAAVPPIAPSDDHAAVWLDNHDQLWADYPTSPPSDAVLPLVWASEQAQSRSDLEDQGVTFRRIGWSR